VSSVADLSPYPDEGNVAAAWELLETVPDPELPTLSVLDLGIVRAVHCVDDQCTVTITPTYSGCPAMDTIRDDIIAAFARDGRRCEVRTQLAPAWTTDWIRPQALPKFRALGIAPPHMQVGNVIALHRKAATIACPQCESHEVMQLSHFSSTACKALYRCIACKEPFDYFKPI
jgi:ring-1,2-phenylacetyl-CoA epoxidase subunit PaaD